MGQPSPSETYNIKNLGLPFFQGKAEFGAIYPTIDKQQTWATCLLKLEVTTVSVISRRFI